jgi:hypothetical protein
MAGAAKRRGTFEQRKDEALKGKAEELAQKEATQRRLEAAMTPAQKKQQQRNRLALMATIGMVQSLDYAPGSPMEPYTPLTSKGED